MEPLNEEVIRKIQLKCIVILDEIIRICDKHEIKFFLVGGTALGARRHQGFIPWDDDIDIGMLRKDYEKFLNICKSELSPEFYLQAPNSEEVFAFAHTKIRLNNTVYKEHAVKDLPIHHGVFVDIFPYDNVSENILVKQIQKYGIKILEAIRIAKITNNQNQGIKGIIKKVLKRIYPNKLLIAQYEYLLKISMNENSSDVCNFLGAYSFERELLTKVQLGNGMLVSFEKYQLLAPEKLDEVLTCMYGPNFNELPPVEKRYNHSAHEIGGI